MKTDGAVFDMDGTLLDSMFIWDNAGSNYLKSVGIDPGEGYNRKFGSIQKVAQFFRREYGVPYSEDEIIDGLNAIVEVQYKTLARLKAGVKELLERLEAKGIPMCVATATDRYLAEAALEKVGILRYFSEIFTTTEVGVGKDKPDIYFAAAKHLKSEAGGTLVFEDSLFAARVAKSAGFPVVGVYDQYEQEAEALKALSDFYVTRLDELVGKLF